VWHQNQVVNEFTLAECACSKREAQPPFPLCVGCTAVTSSYSWAGVLWTTRKARHRRHIRGIRASKLWREQRNEIPRSSEKRLRRQRILSFSAYLHMCTHETHASPFTAGHTPAPWKPIHCPFSFFMPPMFLMSGEVVDSISNLHELIGHCCVPFPLITEAWHFSLSLPLIYTQIIHSLVNPKVLQQQFESSRWVLRKLVWNEKCVLCLFLFRIRVCLFVCKHVKISAAVWDQIWRKLFSSIVWEGNEEVKHLYIMLLYTLLFFKFAHWKRIFRISLRALTCSWHFSIT